MAVSPTSRRLVHQRARGLCEYCHADERWQFVRFTIDHNYPRSKGGNDLINNLALACRNCNERRSNRSQAIDPISGQTVEIFDPRRSNWGDHFAWRSDMLHIVGRTPVGRATVELLDMNDDQHDGVILRIRQRDVRDGFHSPIDDPIIPT